MLLPDAIVLNVPDIKMMITVQMHNTLFIIRMGMCRSGGSCHLVDCPIEQLIYHNSVIYAV